MNPASNVWVVDDERSIRWVLEKALSQVGIKVTCFDNGQSLINKLNDDTPDAIVSDIRMPGIDGLDLLERIKQSHPGLPVVIMTAHSDLGSAVASIQGGAFEYMPKPFEVDEAVSIVQRAIEHNVQSTNEPTTIASHPETEIIGKAPAMQEVFRAIGRLSKSNVSVLINGKSGTGKELVAKALHKHSPRAEQTFIALNMAAIPHDLVESELFGHEKGSFTGANHLRKGRFEQADKGTLFLDEIGDMPPETQTRLLRVLSDGEYYRVGATAPLKADVRIIAATHQNLESLVAEGKFREDLFHRLNVIRIHLPSLTQRREDIPVLTEYFLAQAAIELNESEKRLTKKAMAFITDLPWPGNVRQLENFCRWIIVMAPGKEVAIDDLPPELLEEKNKRSSSDNWEDALRHWAERELSLMTSDNPGLLHSATPLFEKILIDAALNQTGGRKNDAAILLGWGRNTLTRKIHDLRRVEEK